MVPFDIWNFSTILYPFWAQYYAIRKLWFYQKNIIGLLCKKAQGLQFIKTIPEFQKPYFPLKISYLVARYFDQIELHESLLFILIYQSIILKHFKSIKVEKYRRNRIFALVKCKSIRCCPFSSLGTHLIGLYRGINYYMTGYDLG